MTKIPLTDPRAAHMSSNTTLDEAELAATMQGRNHWVLATTRRDNRPQLSLVTGGMTPDGRLLVSTYPERAKARNVRHNPAVSVLALGPEFNDAWIQIDGTAVVVDMPDAADELVDYYRCISGEHPDWDEYRAAMMEQGKCAIRVVPERWGPLSKGGFPPSLFEE